MKKSLLKSIITFMLVVAMVTGAVPLPDITMMARASMCTNLLGNLSDVGVQHQMGHSDIATTRKYYQRFKTSVKEMREKMNNLIQY